MHRRILASAAAVSLLCGGGGIARAATYDAGRDLLANEKPDNAQEANNPNATVPQWSYGYRATATGTDLTLFTSHVNGTGPNGTFDGFNYPPDPANRSLPLVSVNTGAPAGDPQGSVATGEMLIHPNGSDAGNFAAEQKAVVRFTTPTAGQYNVTALWEDLDDCCGTNNSNGPGVDVHVVVNGSSIFDDAISRETGANDPNNLPTSTTFATSTPLTLAPGDTVDFVIGTNGQLYGDSTRFNATLDLVPEPGSLGLLGVAAVGLIARRRRTA